jgi:hypothetical protein
MKISASRVVTLMAPVFAAGSAVLTPWVVKYTGLHIDATQVTALAITGAVTGGSAALKWLHGNSLWEREYGELQKYWLKFEPDAIKAKDEANAADPGIVQDIEGQADKVVEAARAKLVAIIAPSPAGAVVVPVAPVPTPAVPEPEAAA